ncbi:MAG: hypothetical protein ACOZNI_11710 [Myxococcota bacterium]
MPTLGLFLAVAPSLVARVAAQEASEAPAAEPAAVTPEEMEALRERLRQLEAQLDEQVRATEANAPEEIPLDLETKVHGYVDASLRSYNGRRFPLLFRLGSAVLRYDGNLDHKAFFSTELLFEATDQETLLRIEKVDMAVHVSDALHVSGGKTITMLTQQDDIGIAGAYRFLAVTQPETLEPETSDSTLPLHSLGLRATGTFPVGFWQLRYGLDASNGRRALYGEMAHVWDYDAMKAITAGLWVESPGGLTLGGVGYVDILDAIGIPEGQQGLAEDYVEIIGAGHLRYNGPKLDLLGEVFYVRHSPAADFADAASNVSGYLQGGYKVRKTTPYARFEHNQRGWNSEVYRQLSEPHVMTKGTVGLRYDFAVHACTKLEFGYSYETDIDLDDGSTSIRPVNPSGLLQLAAGF